jgi:hypothetical protein
VLGKGWLAESEDEVVSADMVHPKTLQVLWRQIDTLGLESPTAINS